MSKCLLVTIYKFGGASVQDANGVKNVCDIIKNRGEGEVMVVVSAMGKNTNALESVVDAYFKDRQKAVTLFTKIIQDHSAIASELGLPLDQYNEEIDEIVASVEWLLEVEPEDPYNYVYDQIVSLGELISSKILVLYLNSIDIEAKWLDIRDIIVTDDTYREAKVNWTSTENNVNRELEKK